MTQAQARVQGFPHISERAGLSELPLVEQASLDGFETPSLNRIVLMQAEAGRSVCRFVYVD